MNLSRTGGRASGGPGGILLLAMLPIGDTLLVTPTIRALRRRYPRARIVALAHARSAPVLRQLPTVDEVLVLPTGPDWAGPAALIELVKRLRARRLAAAVDFTSPAYKWIPFLAGVPVRTYMKLDRLWWLLPGQHRRWRETHAAEHYYACAAELDLPPWEEVDHRVDLYLPEEAQREASRLLAEAVGPADGKPLVCLHPGGAGMAGLKRWPAARFAQTAERLAERYGATIILLGGPDERELADGVAAAMRARAVVAAGKLSLLGSMALIAQADLFVGNDSSLLHAAAALGTRYVGIFGPTGRANFRPIPAYPGQGVLVEPSPPCGEPTYFVGGRPRWWRPSCRARCAALLALPTGPVLAAAERLLEPASARAAVA